MTHTPANRETFDSDPENHWPPSDDVLHTLLVVDLQSGASSSVTSTAVVRAAGEPDSQLIERPTPARWEAVQPDASPSAVIPRRRVGRSQWLLVAVGILALGEGLYIGSTVLRSSPQASIGTMVPPTVAPPKQFSSVATTGAAAPAAAAEEHKLEAPQVPEVPQPVPRTTGSLQVRSDPPGARVWIDGRPQGETPLTAQGLAPGTHAVVLEGAGGRIQQSVVVEAGARATLLASVSEASGGIALTAPAELQVLEGGRLLGTSRAERILMESGKHTIDLVNEAIGYQSRQVVDVAPGKITRITVPFPNGTLNINALPWAEVTLDGRPIGETPIGNLSVRAGSHEVVFRHPELGEIKRKIDVTLLAPARLSVDLQRKDK